VDETKLKTLKRYFLTGLFVLIPVAFTVVTVFWLIGTLDGLLGGMVRGLMGFHIPGLGIVMTVGLILLVGMLMSNLLFKQMFDLFEEALLRVPGVRVIYKTVKALTETFSPENQKSFRNVVLVEYPHPGSFSLGFVTGQTVLTVDGASQKHAVVYVPTNHFYLGNTLVVPESKVLATTLSVQDGIQLVLSSGAGFPDQLLRRGLEQK